MVQEIRYPVFQRPCLSPAIGFVYRQQVGTVIKARLPSLMTTPPADRAPAHAPLPPILPSGQEA